MCRRVRLQPPATILVILGKQEHTLADTGAIKAPTSTSLDRNDLAPVPRFILPGAPEFKDLRPASAARFAAAGPLRDLLSTVRTLARSRHAARCAFLDDSGPGSPA